MADLTYNQGIHGAQDTANAMVRAGRPFAVVTERLARDGVPRRDRRLGARRRGRDALAVAEGRRVRLRDERRWATSASTSTRCCARSARRSTRSPPGDAAARRRRGRAATTVAALIADEDARFEIDPRLSADEREDHARMQLALRARSCDAGGYGAYSTHFGAIAEDGRFARLPLAAASSLMAKGYGYAAEGDALTAALMVRGADAARPDPVHRDVRDGLPERLDPDEPHGRGQLARSPATTGRCG